MGGKQSTEAGEHHHHQGGETSQGGGLTTSRRSTVIGGSMRTHRRVLQFNNDGTSSRGSHSSRNNISRTNSTLDQGLRIPRNRLSWLYHRDHNGGDDDSSPDDDGGGGRNTSSDPSRFMLWLRERSQVSQSLPPYLIAPMRDSKCQMCGKLIPAEDIEVHFVMCLTKPRVTYNEDVMSSTSGECSICLEDLEEGDAIARLPCLCIYHKDCIDQWFKKSQTCPEHPPD